MKTILFVPCYDGHIRVFAPVIQRLSERSELEPLVVFLEKVHGAGLLEFLTANNLPFTRLSLSSYSAREGQGLSGRAQNAFNYARFLFYRRRYVSKFFDRINPVFVVTATDGFQADGDFLYEAKRRGIPSLCLFSVMTSPSFAEESKKTISGGK